MNIFSMVAIWGVSLALLAGCASWQSEKKAQPQPKRWAAYYGHEASKEAFAVFDMLVLEPDHFTDIRSITHKGQTVLGYVSIGEIHPSRPYAAAMEEQGAFIGMNEQWGAHSIDIRNAAWRNYVLE